MLFFFIFFYLTGTIQSNIVTIQSL